MEHWLWHRVHTVFILTSLSSGFTAQCETGVSPAPFSPSFLLHHPSSAQLRGFSAGWAFFMEVSTNRSSVASPAHQPCESGKEGILPGQISCIVFKGGKITGGSKMSFLYTNKIKLRLGMAPGDCKQAHSMWHTEDYEHSQVDCVCPLLSRLHC